MDERITQLELRFMAQQDLVDQLNKELIEHAKTIERLEARVKRLETTLEEVVGAVFVHPNEKPPHY